MKMLFCLSKLWEFLDFNIAANTYALLLKYSSKIMTRNSGDAEASEQ